MHFAKAPPLYKNNFFIRLSSHLLLNCLFELFLALVSNYNACQRGQTPSGRSHPKSSQVYSYILVDGFSYHVGSHAWGIFLTRVTVGSHRHPLSAKELLLYIAILYHISSLYVVLAGLKGCSFASLNKARANPFDIPSNLLALAGLKGCYLASFPLAVVILYTLVSFYAGLAGLCPTVPSLLKPSSVRGTLK